MTSDRTLYAAVALSAAVASLMTFGITRWTAPAQPGGEAVRAYLLEHPEVLPEAMARLRDKETAQIVAANRAAIETPFAGGWMGAKDGDVVLVQFFDYACGYCRASLADVQRLIAEDPKLKVVFRELPVLSPESETAARVSLAAAEQGKFPAFHDALYAAGRPGDATIGEAREKAGLDLARTREIAASPQVQQELEKNLQLARQLGFNGTPGWVVGDSAFTGAVGYAALKKAVAEARDAKRT